MRVAASSSASRRSGVERVEGGAAARRRDPPVAFVGQGEVVEPLGIFGQRLVAARCARPLRIVGHRLRDIAVAFAAVVDDAGELLREIRARDDVQPHASGGLSLSAMARNASTSAANARIGLERGAVDDQSGGNRQDHVALSTRPFSARVAPGGDKIDDPLRQAQAGGELHRAVQLDAFGLDALASRTSGG